MSIKKIKLLFFIIIINASAIAQFKFTDNSREEYISMLKRYKWDDSVKVFSLVEPYIKIDTDTFKVKIGVSKFGGTPDLPKEVKWPFYSDSPMVFSTNQF